VFTGIVRERGAVTSVEGGPEGLRIVVEAPAIAGVTALGDSISVDGVDLTATEIVDGRISFHAVPETLARTTLGSLAVGAEVNLEPALRAGEPLGGHYVQGHVDGVARVRALADDGDAAMLWLDLPNELLRYCVTKGSIAVDGVSLTIAAFDDAGAAIALVPHTLRETTLSGLRPGDPVNIEVDLLAKYVERLAASGEVRSGA
jgi:riboflavin synthase alpha subunit